MTKDERDALRALARAATPGPWEVFDPRQSITVIATDTKYGAISICTVSINTRHDEGRHNRDYIAACSPDRIIALLDRIEAMELVIVAASHALRSYQYGNGSPELAQSAADAIDAAIAAWRGE